MVDTAVEETYTLTTDNIKLPTFFNKELEDSLLKEVTPTSLIENITILQTLIQKGEVLFLDLVQNKRHDINDLITKVNRGVIKYFFYFEELKRMVFIVLNKFKIQQKQDGSAIAHYPKQSVTEIYDSFEKDDLIKNMIFHQFRDQKDINKFLTPLINREFTVLKSNQKVGINLLSNTILYAQMILKDLLAQIDKFKEIPVYVCKENKDFIENEIIFLDLILMLDKLSIISLSLHNVSFVKENDICNLPEDSEEWNQIKKIMIRVVSKKNEQIIKEIEEVGESFATFGAMTSKSVQSKSIWKNLYSGTYSMINYKAFPRSSLVDYKKSIINENDLSFVTMTSLMKYKWIRAATLPTYPRIHYRKKLYLKRYEKEITLSYIKDIMDHLELSPNKPLPLPEIKVIEPTSIEDKENALYLEKVEKKEKLKYVSTRLIHSSFLPLKNDEPPNKWMEKAYGFMDMIKKPKPQEPVDSLIIYIHGGGFIGGTTLGNETFLRQWANTLEIPIIGIDYNIAPKHPYPKSLDDVWQAYNWIIKNAKDQWSINPKNIILTGDSAGGSLCLSLTFLLIAHNIQLPNLLFLPYPGCETDLNGMSNSQLLIFQDKLLNYKFLSYCNTAFVGKYPNTNDYFLNQTKAPLELLKKLPKTRFFISSSDPLRDGVIRLIQKIAGLNIDCKAYEFMNLTHGFLNWNKPGIIENPMAIFLKEVREVLPVKTSIEMISTDSIVSEIKQEEKTEVKQEENTEQQTIEKTVDNEEKKE